MSIVFAAYAPNAPFLIHPPSFEGVGARSARALADLRLLERVRPEVILVSTPHWVSTGGLRVNIDPHPRQVFDFSGMPPALAQVRYAPPGDPDLARKLVEEGQHAGLPVQGTRDWGLDHGAWAPLMHLAPGARVPVVPLSITASDPDLHLRWGRTIRLALLNSPQRVAFIATGSIVHDFARFRQDPGARWPEGERIEAEILERVVALDQEGLAKFDRRKWDAVKPEGGLGPLFTLLGAVGDDLRPRIVDQDYAFGGFSMSTVAFEPHQG